MNTGHSVVDAIDKIRLVGNIIPHTWYQTITIKKALLKDAGERVYPDLNAILILAEIVFFYRSTVDMDEQVGKKVTHTKRFKADKFQRSVAAFVDRLGLSEKQVREALHRLRDSGLITIELRTVRDGAKVLGNNVMFLEPVPAMIEAVTFPTPGDLQVTTPGALSGPIPLSVTSPGTPSVTTLSTYREPASLPIGIDEYTEHTQSTTQISSTRGATPHSYGAVDNNLFSQPEETEPVQARDSSKTPPVGPPAARPADADLLAFRDRVRVAYPRRKDQDGTTYGPSSQGLDRLGEIPEEWRIEFVEQVQVYADERNGKDAQYTKGLPKFIDEIWAPHLASKLRRKGKRRVISSTPYDKASIGDIMESLGIKAG